MRDRSPLPKNPALVDDHRFVAVFNQESAALALLLLGFDRVIVSLKGIARYSAVDRVTDRLLTKSGPQEPKHQNRSALPHVRTPKGLWGSRLCLSPRGRPG